MNKYKVLDKTTGELVYKYEAQSAVEWNGYPYSAFDHVLDAPVEAAAPKSTTEWLIDIGPFFDRFSTAKMAVLTSTHPVVKAILQDVTVRKWVDLRRPDVVAAIAAIRAVVPTLTEAMADEIVTKPVQEEENMALRMDYFKE